MKNSQSSVGLQRLKLHQKLTKLVIEKLMGWRMEGELPDVQKFVVIGGHHTSWWDAFFVGALIIYHPIRVFWLGKKGLFQGPLGWLPKMVRGIPVERSKRTNLVDYLASYFAKEDKIAMAIYPEGTRGKVDYWKTGFYYVSLKAKVPILMAYLDYTKKVCGLGPLLYPSGDIEADFEIIRNFYKEMPGKYPEKSGIIRLRPEEKSSALDESTPSSN